MMRKLLVISCLVSYGIVLNGAVSKPNQRPQFKFNSVVGEKAFLEGKKAFMNKDYKTAKKQIALAGKEAANLVTKKEVFRWSVGLKGLKDLLLLEQKVQTNPSWTFVNAQKRLLFYYTNPAGILFRNFIAKLENPEKKLIKKVENFERRGPYSFRFGRSYCYKQKLPQFVIEGERSLKWECKNKSSRALVIPHFPKDCSKYKYICFWMYGTKGKNTQVYLYLRNEEKKDNKGRSRSTRFNGFQTQLPPFIGWKYIVLDLDKGFSRRGSGSMKKISGLQLQLPNTKSFVTYLDDFVLVAKK